MFEYLDPEEVCDITLLSMESFVKLYFEEKNKEFIAKITTAQKKAASQNPKHNLWRDLVIHYFGLPQPYYLASEHVFLYFYGHRKDIVKFLSTSELTDEKLETIRDSACQSNKEMLAVCFSLSLIKKYKAVGHLICVQTYETLLENDSEDMHSLYATQAYFHAQLLQRQFRETKKIESGLDWCRSFKQEYGKPNIFVSSLFSKVKAHISDEEKILAEELAENTCGIN